MSANALSVQRQMVIVGLNPALQRTVTLTSALQVGSVNRGSAVEVGIGGKGQNCMVAAISMEVAPSPLLVQFLGDGSEGDQLAHLLHQKSARIHAEDLTIRTKLPCRTAFTLVDENGATEVVEPSGIVSEVEVANLLLSLEEKFSSKKAAGVACMGSMPPACPTDLYAQILSKICDSESKVLLDTSSGIFDCLAVCKKVQCDVVIKLNARELLKLADIEFAVKGGEASCAVPDTLLSQACIKLVNTNPELEGMVSLFIALTDGPFVSSLFDLSLPSLSSHSHRMQIKLPPLSRFKNPIGAGDAVSSGTLSRWCNAVPSLPAETSGEYTKWEAIQDAFTWGLGCGSASCMGDSNSVFELNDALDLYKGAERIHLSKED
eukprot:CAMPEP_0119039558 /NCGR_PEP_ID=MMETSP1177-20130426/9122_1 /TAXON_ID=2985 /ORGANISM="Ochromonas sp, Strain CCMP1899" /LENGTH=376 /DNA_ID=CAMNT_0007003605 /DNA_START=168 /DNA_END=1298 /DNA_ORIENTATION=-